MANKKNKVSRHRHNHPQIQPPQPRHQAVFHAEHYSGPIPPPAMLQEFEDITPGFADRILSMAEKQSDHRREIERKAVFNNERRANIGQALAFIITLFAIAAGTYLIMNDKSAEGLAAIIVPLVGLIGVFIYGKNAQRKELEAKNRFINRQ